MFAVLFNRAVTWTGSRMSDGTKCPTILLTPFMWLLYYIGTVSKCSDDINRQATSDYQVDNTPIFLTPLYCWAYFAFRQWDNESMGETRCRHRYTMERGSIAWPPGGVGLGCVGRSKRFLHRKQRSSIWQLCRHWHTVSCHHDNLRCHKWQQSCQSDYFLLSVFLSQG